MRRLREEHERLHVDREEPVELRGARVVDELGQRDAGVADRGVEPAEAVDGHLHRGLARRAVRDVAGERDGLAADLRRGRLERRTVAVDGDDRPAGLREGLDDPGADALARAGDHDAAHADLAAERFGQLRSKTSSIIAHHSPGLASSTRSCIVRMSWSHLR